MAMQYILEEDFIVCTFAINLTPRKINRNPALENQRFITLHEGDVKLYMTIDDKKLDDCFNCKKPAKLWGGLAALVAGIALGAACVLTGGTVLLVIAVAAAVVTVAVPVIAVIAHDCDATLESDWSKYHPTVKIETHNALLKQSFMTCKEGGILHLFKDEVAATDAIRQVCWQNVKETALHIGTQFTVGFITGYTAARTGFVSLGVTATLAVGMEITSLALDISPTSVGGDVAKEAVSYGVSEGATIAANATISKVLLQNGGAVDATLGALVALEKANPRLASKILDDLVSHISTVPGTLKGSAANQLGGLKSGLLIAAVTAGLNIASNEVQRNMERDTKQALERAGKLDSKASSFAVIAENY